VLISYQIAPGNTPENYAAQVAADILGTGKSSRFYQHLVKDKQLATEIAVQADSRRGIGPMYISASPRPGVKPEDVEAGIYQEIAAVAKDGVNNEELEKARMQFRRRTVQSRISALGTAIRLGQYAVFYNDPDLINTILTKYNAVTADDVKKFVSKYMVETARAVVIAVPPAQPAEGQGGAQ
jgi:zinc protease